MFRYGDRARARLNGPRPTARGWGLIAAGTLLLASAATWARQDLLFAGLCLLLLPLACLLVVRRGRAQLVARRSLAPDVVATGTESTVTITLSSPSSSRVTALRWRDIVPGGVEAQPARKLVLDGAAGARFAHGGGTLRLRHRVRADARGVYDIGPLVLTRRDPFGLADCEHAVGDVRQLVVTPRVQRLADGELETIGGDGNEHQVLRRTSPGADELFAREYRSGDPLRRVHWRATARLGELMVRQEEQRSNPEAWIVFDTRASSETDVRHPLVRERREAAFERAVELVASLGARLLELGYRVSVLETGLAQLASRADSSRSGVLAAAAATYEAPGGERSLLTGLARIRQRRRENVGYAQELIGALHRAQGAVPVFAVLLAETDGMAAALAAVAPVSAAAAAFLVDDDALALETPLVESGWRCVRVDGDTDARAAWSAAQAVTSGGV